jgi:hypothetical protein
VSTTKLPPVTSPQLPGYRGDALAEALPTEAALLAEALLLETLLLEALADALVAGLADAYAAAFADELAEALAEVLVLAPCVPDGDPGGPTLTRRVIGVPDSTEVPAAGIVPMTVPGLS